jgi:hypothetical protein
MPKGPHADADLPTLDRNDGWRDLGSASSSGAIHCDAAGTIAWPTAADQPAAAKPGRLAAA